MKRLKNEKGYALIIVIITMVVLFALGSVLINIVLGEFKKVESEKNHLQSYYIARSGAELIADSIIKNKIDAGKVVDTTTDEISLGEGYFQAVVSKDEYNLLIESKGTFRDYTSMVALELNSNVGSLFEDAIFAANNITIEGTAEINGDISLKGDSSFLDITNWDQEEYLEGEINYNVNKFLGDPSNPGISSPGGILKVEEGEEFINEDVYYESVKLETDGIITFILGNTDITLSTDILTNETGGSINVSTTTATNETAVAMIYTEELKGETLSVTNNAPNPGQFIIVVYGDSSENDTIRLETGTEFRGGLYAPNKTIIIEDNVKIEGSLIADNFIIEDGSGGSPSFTYAPIVDKELFPISFSDLTFTKGNWARSAGDLND